MALHKPEHRTVKYWVSWPFLTLLYLGLMPVAFIIGRHEEEATSGMRTKWDWEWYRDLEDYIDDPIDWLKHKLLGIGRLP